MLALIISRTHLRHTLGILYVYLLGLLVTAAVSALTAVWVNRRTADRAGTIMIVLLAIHTVMALLAAGQLLVPSLELKVLIARLWFTLVLVTPIVWVAFAVYFTGREFWLTNPVWAVLIAFAVGLAGILWTEPIHGLLFVEHTIVAEPFRHYAPTWTSATTALILVSNIPVALGFGLLFHMHLFSRRATWRQSGALLFGMLAIFVPSSLSTTPYVPIQGFPYGVFGTGIFGVVISYGLFKQRMFGVVPLARDTIFASLDDGVCIVDADHRVVDFNDAMAALFPGLDDAVGEQLSETYPELLADSTRATAGPGEPQRLLPMQADDEQSGPFASVIELSTATGPRTIRVRVSDITSGGEPRGYVLVLRDVTALEAYASELEQKTEQLEQFASVLSHDLRNPVSVAHGSVTIAQDQRNSEHLETALNALERIDETISDMLTLAKDEVAVAETEPVSLRAVADDAWETSETGPNTLRNEVNESVSIQADRSRLQRLLENLFRNAVEHGGDTVTVGTDDDVFFVEDNGSGIPEADRESVLEYGYSGGDSTGFGLTIVASIADAHGWSLSITDGEDGGARFNFETVTPDTSETAPPATD
ncbi:ATP-binding protein [Haloarcula sp. S1AR25-5A]|uniref:histidine kinase n=1 Tax=Haloarcula terrestris TaxID=2950533 RepID=A0AAE4JI36_9EURY|nr:histidine kinase N-terminal 7TM domain-containing protein [Haloarcula terrestris]MDS0220731.1 ATP-binding protein [Haloarcula terrestris]